MMSDELDIQTGLPIGPIVEGRPAIHPTGATLEGRFVRLEPLDIGRHPAALHRVSHPTQADTLWLYMPVGPFVDEAAQTQHLETLRAKPDYLVYVICDRSTGAVLGQACYLRIDTENRSIEVGYILYSPELQRTPASTEAMYLMARHAFEDLHFRRYEWKCNALNAPSRRAALRLGFAYEGLFRQAAIVKGRNRDTTWFAMTDEDWPMLKRAFEAWLDPTNFEAGGGQRRSLQSIRDAA